MASISRRDSLTAEMLSVGTELLLGEIVDTNSAWLANELSQKGVDVLWSQRVGDNLERIKAAIELALSRSDVVLMCGGLGPTDDDMTREAIAAVAGETPEVDSDLEKTLRDLFARFSREMPEKNLKQAWLIPSAVSLPNPNGTAPGWFVTLERKGAKKVARKIIVALPGPPRELKPMWANEVVPRLDMPSAVFFAKIFKTFDMGESMLAEVLGDDLTQSSNPSVATYAKQDGVHVRVAAKGETEEEAKAIAAPALAEVEEKLAGHIWGTDDDNLSALVIERLSELGITLSITEVGTGGHISNMLFGAAKSLQQDSCLVGATVLNSESELFLESFAEESDVELLATKTQKDWQSDCVLVIGSLEEGLSEAGKAINIVNIAAMDNRDNQDNRSGKTVTKLLKMPKLSYGWQKERMALAALVLFLDVLA